MGAHRDMPLEAAIRAFVRRGDHLHFASTPSRSNAAVLAVARAFVGTQPEFVLSTSGFHSTAHLLARLRLGRRYVACFFGDNHPAPRPNRLYQALDREGALECWSLLAYVASLRAGALGMPWAEIRSLAETSLGAELERAGRFVDGRVAAMRPDVTFVHAPMGDATGRVAFSAPYGEGFWAALGARRGVVATVERLVSAEELDAVPEAVRIAPSRVLAVCPARFGAHPQPLFTTPSFARSAPATGRGYVDDFEHYAFWRTIAEEDAALEDFSRRVLQPGGGDEDAAYRRWAGAHRLEALEHAAGSGAGCAARRGDATDPSDPRRALGEPLVALAAEIVAERALARGHREILAGIGHAFFAAHAAKRALASRGVDVAVMVETGLYDIACGDACHGFLLSHDHIASARALSSVEDALGALTTGADNRCLGVVGAAEVDAHGRVNSTRLGDGTFLVGSGGANDIASAADEVVVLTSCHRRRLVERVAHVTSPGARVAAIATERCVLERVAPGEPRWRVSVVAPRAGESVEDAVSAVRAACTWDLVVEAPRIRRADAAPVARLDPTGHAPAGAFTVPREEHA